MKKCSLLLSFMLCIVHFSFAQTVNTPSTQASYYVQNVLLGNYVGVFNIQSTAVFPGQDSSNLAAFQNFSSTGIGLHEGILMSSGIAQSAVGPNSSGSTGHNLNLGSDALLDSLIAPNNTNDAMVIEFDYIPYTNVLDFTYVFASEEYPEFSISSFNDVFGFFVSGPNPYGGMYADKNIALLPGSNTIVSINNINNGNNNTGPCVNCQYYNHNTGNGHSFDASTVPLDAVIEVIPFHIYHIKLAVADVSDAIYNSAVFLKQNSFSCQPLTYTFTNTSSKSNGAVAVEDSTTATLEISLPATAQTEIVYHLNHIGDAVNGVDYTLSADSIVFPVGSISQTILLTALADTVVEGNEFAKFVIETLEDTLMVEIIDNTVTQPNAIHNSQRDIHLVLSPNPVKDIMHIESDVAFDHYHIYDYTGRKLHSGAFQNNINFETYEKGVYFIQFQANEQIYTRKVIKR